MRLGDSTGEICDFEIEKLKNSNIEKFENYSPEIKFKNPK
jgi:hypothetical protein